MASASGLAHGHPKAFTHCPPAATSTLQHQLRAPIPIIGQLKAEPDIKKLALAVVLLRRSMTTKRAKAERT